jgi:hypothetical protein
MSAADVSLVLSAVAGTLTAVGGVITGVVLLVRELHKTRTAISDVHAELVENTKQTADIHTIVNQQRTDMEERAVVQAARIDGLIDTVRDAGLVVPEPPTPRSAKG